MNFSKIISQNFLCSGVPVQVATVGVEALDVSTGTLYIQKKIPNGTSWVVKSKNYYQTSDQQVYWDEILDKPVNSSKDFIYTGEDLSSIIEYANKEKTAIQEVKYFEYNVGGDVVKKIVEYDSTIKEYEYLYDIDGNLTNINEL